MVFLKKVTTLQFRLLYTVFENHRKSLVHCERSELRLDFEMTKIPFKIGQKLVENAKMRHFQ